MTVAPSNLGTGLHETILALAVQHNTGDPAKSKFVGTHQRPGLLVDQARHLRRTSAPIPSECRGPVRELAGKKGEASAPPDLGHLVPRLSADVSARASPGARGYSGGYAVHSAVFPAWSVTVTFNATSPSTFFKFRFFPLKFSLCPLAISVPTTACA